MRKEVNKTDLITLALVYNYVANDKTSLSVCDVDNFISYLEFMAFNKYFSCGISRDEDDERTCYYIDDKYNYIFRNPENLSIICQRYVDNIPQDIFLETLKQDYLSLIGVKREDLNLVSVKEHKNDSMELFSMGASSASNNAVKILDERGCKNIRVNSVFFLGMKPDYLWRVSVKYDCDRFYLDLGDKAKTYCKRY